MHMAHPAVAWVAWAAWTCNTPSGYSVQKRADFGPLFFVVRPAELRQAADAGWYLMLGPGRQ